MNRKEIRSKKRELNILSDIVTVMKQYFPKLIEEFNGLTDVRHQSYVKYKMKVIFIVRLMGLMCEIKSMQEMKRELNTEETIKNIAQICELKLEEIPHCDTINDVFEQVKVEEIEKIRKYMITSLIRGKMIKKYKIRDRYYHVIVDATGLATSRKKYNENCLVKTKTDKNGNRYEEYSTYVLEAKLVVGELVLSIGSEFVENVGEMNTEKEKQDCEIKAFKRLAAKIKKEYPKLKIVISGDALYANKPVIDICKANGWKYIIRFKEGAIPTLYKEFETVVAKANESTKANYEYVTGLDYEGEKVNVIKYTETKKEKETEFVYITDLSITNKNVEATIVLGRKRWKIENEGFNIQKNGTFDIGHLYSKNQTAIKVHYIMIQIAHIIRQLVEKGISEIKELKLKLKEISQNIKDWLTSKHTNLTVHKKIQLRFE